MKKLILTLSLLSLTTFRGIGQSNYEMPQNIELKSKSDYSKYETDIINAAKWLEETDLDKEQEKRKQIEAFVVQWISGNPKIKVEIGPGLMNLCGENSELMVLYLASYSRHYLEDKNATKNSATKAGIMSMINVHKKGIGVVKNPEMEKAIKLYDQNKLDKYVADKFR